MFLLAEHPDKLATSSTTSGLIKEATTPSSSAIVSKSLLLSAIKNNPISHIDKVSGMIASIRFSVEEKYRLVVLVKEESNTIFVK